MNRKKRARPGRSAQSKNSSRSSGARQSGARTKNKNPKKRSSKASHHSGGKDRETRFDTEPFVGDILEYALLDSGQQRKLEQFGPFILDRPAAQAIWKPSKPELWDSADAFFERLSGGGGRWQFRQEALPECWLLAFGELRYILKLTDFGHCGLFAEQHDQWTWIQEQCRSFEDQHEVLNLFAYTGGSTLAAASVGAKVCHLDAARGIVDWARENAKRSSLEEQAIRWIVDDAQVYLRREQRRGRKYHGLILDPPSFGRGKKGELWKIEDHLPQLLELCASVLADDARFMLLSCHSQGFSPKVLENLLADLFPGHQGTLSSGEMLLKGSAPYALPSGFFARWSRNQ